MFGETPMAELDEYKGVYFWIKDVRAVLNKYWEPDDVMKLIQAVDRFKIWPNDDRGLVEVGKLMVAWKAAIRDCKDKGLER